MRPATIVRWHRLGWRIFWQWKCRTGRPPIRPELRRLIRRMATENPLWGQERIAHELLVKLGMQVSPRTVSKYMPKRAPGQPRGDQRWSTFLKNHAKAVLACDFFVAVTATFRVLYAWPMSPFCSMDMHRKGARAGSEGEQRRCILNGWRKKGRLLASRATFRQSCSPARRRNASIRAPSSGCEGP